ncbi:hypothetical protein NQ317_005954 [Molorchus minor]|uniref:Uncharacterized protein n=1 Tax=Molorchus minor TaxID=1323400 RepID=A0ABQ9JK70_9CUCU|nr:hypothetical protein NQ317_005954 [Molorchus minor]
MFPCKPYNKVLISEKSLALRGTIAKEIYSYNNDMPSAVDAKCISKRVCQIGNTTLKVDIAGDSATITRESLDAAVQLEDCYDLRKDEIHWYGGPERKVQKWPLEKQVINGSEAYVLKATDNFAVAERYWLSSEGVFIYIDETVPLFIDQNNLYPGMVCFQSRLEGPYINRTKNVLKYTIVVNDGPKKGTPLRSQQLFRKTIR